MVVLSDRLVYSKEIDPDDLTHIEHPNFAVDVVRHLSDTECHQLRASLTFPYRHYPPIPWIGLTAFRDALTRAVLKGEIFLLRPSPMRPMVRRRFDSVAPIHAQWAYCGGDFDLLFRSAVEWTIYNSRFHRWGRGGAAAAPPFDSPVRDDSDTTIEAAHSTREPVPVRRASMPSATETPFVTGLGSEVDAIAARSPSLQAQMRQLDNADWRFGYGAAPPSITRYPSKRIDISPDLQQRPDAVVQQLAHEVGHALHPTQWDTRSRATYIDGALRGEGWATLNNVTVQHEILAAGGPDIGVASANPSLLVPQYQAIYREYTATGDADRAVHAIGKLYGQHEITGGGVPYTEYYGGAYDRRFGH